MRPFPPEQLIFLNLGSDYLEQASQSVNVPYSLRTYIFGVKIPSFLQSL